MKTEYFQGSFKAILQKVGEYRLQGDLPDPWFYRSESGRIELHFQVKTGNFMTHYRIILPASKKPKERK